MISDARSAPEKRQLETASFRALGTCRVEECLRKKKSTPTPTPTSTPTPTCFCTGGAASCAPTSAETSRLSSCSSCSEVATWDKRQKADAARVETRAKVRLAIAECERIGCCKTGETTLKEASSMAKAKVLKCILKRDKPIVINNVRSHASGWKRMEVTVDSGAAESVIPLQENTMYKTRKHGVDNWYQTASGEPIIHEGEQTLLMVTPSGKLRAMTFQACDVTKPLASVQRMVDAGQVVVFAPESMGGSYILNVETGEKEPMREEEGNFIMDVWVPPSIACLKVLLGSLRHQE